MKKPVLAFETKRSNASLIKSCHDLGYIKDEDRVLDVTYGKGTFWNEWHPLDLITNDLDLESKSDLHFDFRYLPIGNEAFEVVVFDPPYKLNGTPSGEMDDRYGVGEPMRWQDKMQKCIDGVKECTRVCNRTLLVKCMDQVCSGKIRWQSLEFTTAATESGFELTDMLLMASGRPQPEGRTQRHARRNYSTLLVLERTS